MYEPDPKPNAQVFDLYRRSQDDILKLKSRLPEETVADLAREVLRRMAGHADAFSIEDHADEIEELCNALISLDADAGAAYVRKVRAEGASFEDVYLGYLAGAAKMLGEWWENDLATFSEVTIGSSRMYAIMRAMSYQNRALPGSVYRSAVFASVPGETHTLGIRMATDIFRKDGWVIDLKSAPTHDGLVQEIGSADAQVIGLSAGGRHSIQPLARLVVALRIVCPAALILVSGQIVNEAEDLVALMGVDAVAEDIPGARVALNRLWSEATKP